MLKEKDNRVAFLKGLSFKSNEKDIEEFFGKDKISQIKIVLDDKGRNKGMAFVEFVRFV